MAAPRPATAVLSSLALKGVLENSRSHSKARSARSSSASMPRVRFSSAWRKARAQIS